MGFFTALVVGDAPSVSSTLSNVLVRLGWQVTVVPTTDEAIGALEGGRFSAVFTELCARGTHGGGRGMARWIKSHGNGTACFVMTSWRGQLDQGLLTSDGISGVIRKPLIFNEIRDEVLEYFG
jgi:CheY-like chemotaxis protein